LKRAVIYCRVSTKEQVEEGNSLTSQERICKEYALQHGFHVAELFIEEGESAKTANRTKLLAMLSYCSLKKNDIKAVIAYKIDRIARNTDDYSYIRATLKRHGVEIKSTSENFEVDTPAGRFMENMIANVAQFDNDVRSERCKGGMIEAMREGRYVWGAPCGYVNSKVNGKSTIILTKSAPIIYSVFREVADNVHSIEHVRRKFQLTLLSSKGNPLSRSQFFRMLRNKVYFGCIEKFGERHIGTFETIISESLYNQVQNVLSGKNKKTGCYIVNHPDFPLRRFVNHPFQHSKLTGSWSKGRNKRYAYYRFMAPKAHFQKEQLELKFRDFLDSFKLDDNCYKSLKAGVNKYLVSDANIAAKKIEKLNSRLSELDKKQAAAYEMLYAGTITGDMLKRQLTRLESEESEIKSILRQEPEVNYDLNQALKRISNFLKSPGTIWYQAPFHFKTLIQWFVFPQGVLFDGKNFRTNEMCKHFKAKTYFFSCKSHGADLKFKKSNTYKTTNSQTDDIEQALFWKQIREELVVFNKFVENNKLEKTSLPP
jgi:site-specific DNA recombinase